MENPNYVIYVSEEEVEAFRYQQQMQKQREILATCEALEVVGLDGKLKAAVDIDTYQYLVEFLMKHTEPSSKSE